MGFQDPADAAAAFCVENLDPSSHSEAFTRCSETLSSSIIERIGASNFTPSQDAQITGQQQQQQHQHEWEGQAGVHGSEDVVSSKPLLTVPLNINGLETTLQMYEGAGPEGVANEFCRREEFAFEGQSLNSCYSQVGECALYRSRRLNGGRFHSLRSLVMLRDNFQLNSRLSHGAQENYTPFFFSASSGIRLWKSRNVP